MFLSVLTAGLLKGIMSGLSEPAVPVMDVSKLLRASGGKMFPGTGGTFAHKLISPESFPWWSLRFVVDTCGTSAGVQFRFLSCFSGEESSESSNISSSLIFTVPLRFGERSWFGVGDCSREDAGLDFEEYLSSSALAFWES